MRQKMGVTRTISTSVEEKDWKLLSHLRDAGARCLHAWATGARVAAAAGVREAEGPVEETRARQPQLMGALALIGAGLGGLEPHKTSSFELQFPPAKKGRAHQHPKLLPAVGGCAERRN